MEYFIWKDQLSSLTFLWKRTSSVNGIFRMEGPVILIDVSLEEDFICEWNISYGRTSYPH
jgi:hypothetical protein